MSTRTAIRGGERFLFDRCFAEASSPPAVVAALDAAPEVEVFTAEDVAQARAEGFVEGRSQALAEAEAVHTSGLENVLATFMRKTDELLALARNAAEGAAGDAALVGVAIARKLLPRHVAACAAEEIERLVVSVIGAVSEEPALTIRVAATLAAELDARLADAARAHGYTGQVRLVADTAIPEGDCRLDWRGGGLVRRSETIWQDIEALIDEAVGSVPGAGVGDSPDQPGGTHA